MTKLSEFERGYRLGNRDGTEAARALLPTDSALGDFIASKVLGNDEWTPHGLARDILSRIGGEPGTRGCPEWGVAPNKPSVIESHDPECSRA